MEIASMKIWYILLTKRRQTMNDLSHAKQHDLANVHDPVLITSNEASELNLLSQKRVHDVKK